MCSHSLWSLPPSQLSCEASNNTNTVVRNGGRNLPVSSLKLPHQADNKCFLRFQASAHLDLGVRAGQKLREMARREEEEEVKTKVRQIQQRLEEELHEKKTRLKGRNRDNMIQ